MADLVKLHNTNKVQTEVTSADGQSIMLMPGAKENVEDVFAWNLPKGVKIWQPTEMVFGTDEPVREIDLPSDTVVTPSESNMANKSATVTTAPTTTAQASAKAEAKKS